MNQDRALLSDLLANMETELRANDCWSELPPAPEAFDSQVPFFLDKMDFTDWLQWVFIARFRAILEENHDLPPRCDVAPIAEEVFQKLDFYTDPLLGLIRRFDQTINNLNKPD